MGKRTNLKILLVLSVFLLQTASAVAEEIITVNDDGPANYNNIQAAIDDSNDGDIIIVSPGRYTGPGNHDIDFLGKAITVRSTDPNDPEIVAATIIDCNGTRVESHRGFNFHNNEEANSILAGFTITRGYITDFHGGAILCDTASPTITNCAITDNDAISGGGIHCEFSNPTIINCTIRANHAYEFMGGNGGAIYCRHSSPNITNCTISNNWASWRFGSGGGIYCYDSSPNITNCSFNENSAGYKGGAIYNCDGRDLTLAYCTFSANWGQLGGAIHCCDATNVKLTGCTFIGNSAKYAGGMHNLNSDLVLTECIFTGNSSDGGCGGMYNYSSSPVLTNCTFSENLAAEHAGGIENDNWSSPVLTNCMFVANSAEWSGGGMYNEKHSSPTLNNCAFTENVSNSNGGAICNDRASPTLTDCTLVGNWARTRGGGMASFYQSSPILVNCTLEDNTAYTYDGGAINSGNSDLTMRNCTVSDNLASEDGGALSNYDTKLDIVNCKFIQNSAAGGNGGAIYGHGYLRVILTNCMFIANCAQSNGGSIFNKTNSDSQLINCTLSANSAGDNGGGISNARGCATTLANCIFWGNTDSGGTDESAQVDGAIAKLEYCCVQGWTGALGGIGNISDKPLFVEPGYWADVNDSNIIVEPDDPNAVWVDGDYHLLSSSPCIDAGDNSSLPMDIHDLDDDGNTAEPIPFDLDGNPRIVDGDSDGNCVVDMGAYEFFWPPIEVPMKFTPQVFNPCSKGKWVKAHLVLPEGLELEDVDDNTPATLEVPGIEIASEYIDVFTNEDGLVEVKIAFGRAAFSDAAKQSSSAFITVTVEGSLITGQHFYGTDTIKIVSNKLKCVAALASHWLEQDCGKPDWCDGLDLNRDSKVNFVDLALFDGCCIEIITE